MNLNDIPKKQTKKFPIGVTEQVFDTMAEMRAFIAGLCYADDTDVENGDPFERNGKVVVRVRVGNFDEDEDVEEDEE